MLSPRGLIPALLLGCLFVGGGWGTLSAQSSPAAQSAPATEADPPPPADPPDGGAVDAATWTFAQYRPYCAGCHANNYKAGVDKHHGLTNDLNCGNSGCHSVSSREW